MSKVLVIGDFCQDVYIYGKCPRMSPAAPVPIFEETNRRMNMGMAGNVFSNLSSLGVDTFLNVPSEPSFKTRYVEEKTNQMIIRVDSGEKPSRIVLPQDEEFLEYDAIIISDYDKGFLTAADIEHICRVHPHVFLDTKKRIGVWSEEAFCIKINEQEYEKSFPQGSHNYENLIITLSERGCVYRGDVFEVERVEVKDLAGAGDTFLAGLVAKWLEREDMVEAIKFANKCATKVVQQRGVNIVGNC